MPVKSYQRYLEWRKERARVLRKQLFACLLPFCRHCGATDKLEFDLKIPGGDKHHRMNPYQRILFYWREHRRRNVQVLCESCNARKGDGPDKPCQQTLELTADHPF